jgi:hypothetical protein
MVRNLKKKVAQEARVKIVGRDRVPNPKIARDLTDLVQDLVIVRRIDTTGPDLDPGIGRAGLGILIDKVVKEKAGKDITDDQDRDQEIEFRDDLHLDSGVKGLDVFHENLHLLGGNLHQLKI